MKAEELKKIKGKKLEDIESLPRGGGFKLKFKDGTTATFHMKYHLNRSFNKMALEEVKEG